MNALSKQQLAFDVMAGAYALERHFQENPLSALDCANPGPRFRRHFDLSTRGCGRAAPRAI